MSSMSDGCLVLLLMMMVIMVMMVMVSLFFNLESLSLSLSECFFPHGGSPLDMGLTDSLQWSSGNTEYEPLVCQPLCIRRGP
jgi:hypothetical protein